MSKLTHILSILLVLIFPSLFLNSIIKSNKSPLLALDFILSSIASQNTSLKKFVAIFPKIQKLNKLTIDGINNVDLNSKLRNKVFSKMPFPTLRIKL
jgi:hypothetical protein